MTINIRTILSALALSLVACTDANPGRDISDGATDADGTSDADLSTPDDVDGARPARTPTATKADASQAPGLDVDAATDTTPEACDNPLERDVPPDCAGGTLERDPEGLIVCRWPCVAHTDTTVVIRKRGPCYVVEDMVCHQCLDRIPEGRDPGAMVCPDVVALAW